MDEGQVRQVVDDMLLDRGGYDPVELLLRMGFINFSGLRRWQADSSESLDNWFTTDPAEPIDALRRASRYAEALGLRSRRHGGGETAPTELRVSDSAELTELVGNRYLPAVDAHQPDLFMPDTVAVLENRITGALVSGALGEASKAMAELRKYDPGHFRLPGFETLLQSALWPYGDAPDCADALTALQSDVTPLAWRLLRSDASKFLERLWQWLAIQLSECAFDTYRPELHSSFAEIQVGNWPDVLKTVEQEPRWQKEPVLICRRALALHRLGNRPEAMQAWHSLCWSMPEEAAKRLVSPDFCSDSVRRLWRDFLDTDLGERPEDFPSWHLLTNPDVVLALGLEHVPAGEGAWQAYRTLHRMLDGRGASHAPGKTEIELRRSLQETHPMLFQAYLLLFGSR